MGIHGLLPFLESKHCCSPFTNWPEKATIAIDVPIFAYKFIYSERTYEALERRFLLFAKQLSETCRPIFVFDGEKMDLKANEVKKRSILKSKALDKFREKQSKEIEQALDCANAMLVLHCDASGTDSASNQFEAPIDLEFKGILFPTRKEYETLELFLKSHGYETRRAKHEAEALCAHLTQTNEAWACMTEDSDAIAFGSKKTILRFFTSPILVEYDTILQNLDISRETFTDLCCMFGCDFCDNVYLIGPKKTYDLLKKYKSWPELYDASKYGWQERTRSSAETFQSKYVSVKTCFDTRAFEC